MDFILNNFEAVTGAILAVGLIIYALVTKQWSVMQVAAYRLMLSAERLMATSEGKEKMETVFTAIWSRIPKWLKKFVTEETLREKLQDWYNIAKNSLAGDSEGETTSK